MVDSKNRILTEYLKLLGWLSLLLMLVTIGEGLVASISYYRNANVLEGISKTELAQRWTIALLWIPVTLQLLVLIFLSVRVRKHKNDQTVRHYFKFYFVRTFISSFAYVTFWLCYTAFIRPNPDKGALEILSRLPLIAIALLVYFAVQTTYLITRSSFRTNKRHFTETEIEDRYECICQKLEEVRTSIGDKTATQTEASVIHQWLLKDRDTKVHGVLSQGNIRDLDISHFIEALNRLVRSRGFYNFVSKGTEGSDLPPSVVEHSNRKYIENHLVRPCEASIVAETTSSHRTAGQGEELLKALGSSAREQIATILGGSRRSDRQIGQRDGIAMFPFYTMVFFFSVFLCVAFLFGFAFAFEDKYVRLQSAQVDDSPANNSRSPAALVMNDVLFDDAGRHSVPRVLPPIPYSLNERQEIFYFKAGGAGITTHDATDNKAIHTARINQASLTALAASIEFIKGKGQSVRIELIGRADDYSVAKNTYGSNYELAAARINSVRYLLTEKLIEDHLTQNDLASIDWHESSFSNDNTLHPKEKRDDETSKMTLVLDNDPTMPNSGNKVPREFRRTLDEEGWKSGNRDWSEQLRGFLKRLRELDDGVVTLERMEKIFDDIKKWDGYKLNGPADKAESLADSIDAELYEIEDPPGRRRSVEAYLYTATPSVTVGTQNTISGMALMDYMYFAMGTVTTTGFGDIRPTTPFAKFLCIMANMTEFFFIVVFFNTLLSLKRRQEEPS